MGVVGVGCVKHVLPRGVWGHAPPRKIRWILVGFRQLADYRVLTSAQNHSMLYFLKISGGKLYLGGDPGVPPLSV